MVVLFMRSREIDEIFKDRLVNETCVHNASITDRFEPPRCPEIPVCRKGNNIPSLYLQNRLVASDYGVETIWKSAWGFLQINSNLSQKSNLTIVSQTWIQYIVQAKVFLGRCNYETASHYELSEKLHLATFNALKI